MKNNIFYLDMDSFYASIEEKKFNKNKAIIVSNISDKSIILSANYLARSKGINSGMPLFLAKQKYSNIIICEPNLEEYNNLSFSIEKILKKYTKKIKKLSIDEWCMDFSNTKLIFNNEYELASRIQNEIIKKFELTCSIGISYNLFFAKMASKINKPKNIEIITKNNFKKKLWDMNLKEMHFIGKIKYIEMNKMGFKKISDLASFNNKKILLENFGILGLKMHEYSNGIFNDFDLNKKKTISISKTFSNDLNSFDELYLNFQKILNNILFKLEDMNLLIKTINITIFTKEQSKCKSFTFSNFTNNKSKIIYHSNLLIDKFIINKRINKIGINFINIIHFFEDHKQLNLFESNNTTDIIEKINSKFKSNVISYADKILK